MLTGTDVLTEYKHFTGLKSCLKFLEFRDTMKKKKNAEDSSISGRGKTSAIS